MHSIATISTGIILASAFLSGCAGSGKTTESSAALVNAMPRSYGAIESIRIADHAEPRRENLGRATWIPAWQPPITGKQHILVRLDDGNVRNIVQDSIHELGVGNRVSVSNERVYRY